MAAFWPGDGTGAQAVEDDRVDILEVDVGHALAEVAQGGDRVAAADRVVAHVEADPDHARVEAVDEAVHLGRRLDERPAVGVESGPTAGRDDLGREGVDRLQDGGPAGIGHPRRAWLVGPTCADIAVGRDIEGDHEHVAATVAKETHPLAADRPSRRSSVRRPWLGSTGRPRPGGGRARREPRAAPRLRESRCRAVCPRSRSGRSRRGSSGRPSRGAGRPGRRCSRGSARSRSTRPAGRRRGRRRVERRSGWPATSRARAVIGAAPRPRRPPIARAARHGIPGSGRPTSPSCRGRRFRDRGRP